MCVIGPSDFRESDRFNILTRGRNLGVIVSGDLLGSALPEDYLLCLPPTWLDTSLLFHIYSCKSETLHILSKITFKCRSQFINDFTTLERVQQRATKLY